MKMYQHGLITLLCSLSSQFYLNSTFKTTEFDPNSIYIQNIQSKIPSLKTHEKLLTVCFIVLTNQQWIVLNSNLMIKMFSDVAHQWCIHLINPGTQLSYIFILILVSTVLLSVILALYLCGISVKGGCVRQTGEDPKCKTLRQD